MTDFESRDPNHIVDNLPKNADISFSEWEIILHNNWLDGRFAIVDGERCFRATPYSRWSPLSNDFTESECYSEMTAEFDKYVSDRFSMSDRNIDRLVASCFNDCKYEVRKIDSFIETVKAVKWDGIHRLPYLPYALGWSTSRDPENQSDGLTENERMEYLIAIAWEIFAGVLQRRLLPNGFAQRPMPVLVGGEHIGKSATVRAIFCDRAYSLRGRVDRSNNYRETLRPMLGACVGAEVEECDLFITQNDESALKQVLTAREWVGTDKFEKGVQTRPLRGLFIGTTNQSEFLRGAENTRYAPVFVRAVEDTPNRDELKVTDPVAYATAPIHLDKHPEYVLQIYAEVYAKMGEMENGGFAIPWDHYLDRDNFRKVHEVVTDRAMDYEPTLLDFVGFLYHLYINRVADDKVENKLLRWSDCVAWYKEKNKGEDVPRSVFSDFKRLYAKFGFTDPSAAFAYQRGFRLREKDGDEVCRRVLGL